MTAKKVAVKMSKKINFCDIKNVEHKLCGLKSYTPNFIHFSPETIYCERHKVGLDSRRRRAKLLPLPK